MRARSLQTTLAVAAAGLAVVGSASASPIGSSSEQRAGYVPGQLIVRFHADVDRPAALRDHGAVQVRPLPVAGTVLARLTSRQSVRGAEAAFERDPRVAWAEPNAYRSAGSLPNDPYFDEEWGLRNTGQTVDGAAGADGADISAEAAWQRTTGSPDVKVAVIDSGINFDQPDLAQNIWRNPGESGGGRETNGIDDDANGFVDDWRGWDFVQQDNQPADNEGHGTHVAGTIAARGDNGVGVTGVAWRASLIPVRVLDNLASGTCAEIAAGMAYAVRVGARVVNMSLGGSAQCQAERDVIQSAPNTLFVAIAHNQGLDIDAHPVYPCSYSSPNVICVAATDSSDHLAGFSSYGAHSVDLAAPGLSVLSTFVKWGPKQSLFTDGFETTLDGRWVTGGSPNSWVRTPFADVRNGGYSLASSLLGSAAGPADNLARLTQGPDLTGRRDCAAAVWLRADTPFDPSQPLESQDRLIAETSPDGSWWDRRPNVTVGSNSDFERWLIDLSQLEGRPTGGLRFHLITNASGGGVALDDLEIFCVPPLTSYTGAADEFAFDFGTSMAAPHVSGAAVLMLSLDPALSAGELKRRLLGSADRLPTLAGKTATGGRLNAARALDPLPASAPAAQPAPQPAAPAPASPAVPTQAYALEVDLRALAQSLSARGLRALLRGGGVRADRLHALGPGRFTLRVKGRGGVTVATGSATTDRPAICALRARLTRRGRAMLRQSRRARVTLVLAFAPENGGAVIRRRTTTIPRRTS